MVLYYSIVSIIPIVDTVGYNIGSY